MQMELSVEKEKEKEGGEFLDRLNALKFISQGKLSSQVSDREYSIILRREGRLRS